MITIQTNPGSKFNPDWFIKYCNKNCISHNFLAARIPHQNGVVERRSMTLEDMTRALIYEMTFESHCGLRLLLMQILFLTYASADLLLKRHYANCSKARNQMYRTEIF